jgi:hypothetical protein
MDSENPQPPDSIPVGKIIVAVLMPIAFFGFIAFMTCPRGDKIGTVDVTAGVGTLAIKAERGSVLTFRLDVEPGGKVVESRLGKSTIAVELDQNGKLSATSCSAYEGKVSTSGTWGINGIMLDCRLPVQGAGNASVRVNVKWAPGYTPRRAVFEVRRSSP